MDNAANEKAECFMVLAILLAIISGLLNPSLISIPLGLAGLALGFTALGFQRRTNDLVKARSKNEKLFN